MKDYNKIMEDIKQNLLGRNIRVKLGGEGPEEFTSYSGKLVNAVYDTRTLHLKFEHSEIDISRYGLSFSRDTFSDSEQYLLCSGLDSPLILELLVEEEQEHKEYTIDSRKEFKETVRKVETAASGIRSVLKSKPDIRGLGGEQ